MRRTALNRAADDLAYEVAGDGIQIDFGTRTITSTQFGATNVPKHSTRIECRKYIKCHIKGIIWKNMNDEKSKQKVIGV